MADQIGGGGFSVGAGDEDDLAAVDPLEVTHEIRHQADGDITGAAAAAGAVDKADRRSHQLGQPKNEEKLHRARGAPSLDDSSAESVISRV